MVSVFRNSNLQIDAFDNFLNVFHAQVFSCNVFEMYHFGKYHRVGFVDAVEQDSVLYILGEHFENVATKDLSMEDIKKVVKGINLKVAVTEDTHHNYTWSFRYIDPAKAANEVEDKSVVTACLCFFEFRFFRIR